MRNKFLSKPRVRSAQRSEFRAYPQSTTVDVLGTERLSRSGYPSPRPLWRLPPPASVASSPPFFSAPGSGSPSPVEVAPAGLCRVVASFFSAPGSGSPSPVEVAPAGLCRVVASFFSAPGSGSPSPVEVAPPASVASSLVFTASFFRRPGWLRCGWIWRLRYAVYAVYECKF